MTSKIYAKLKAEAEANGYAWMTAADTAALIREALKAAFPGVKFSISSKSYSGGSSVRIFWTEGPSADAVRVNGSSFIFADRRAA